MRMSTKQPYPRTLVVSNNPFSTTSNNGKTLASFFKDFPKDKIAQLYFSPALPDEDRFQNYFQITDLQMFRSYFPWEKPPGRIVSSSTSHRGARKGVTGKNVSSTLRKSEVARITRELCWAGGKWKTESLNSWLTDFSPEIIFFCAGDSGFAYDITNHIRQMFDAKLVVYITDDYVLPRDTMSPAWWVRRNYLFDKMKETVQQSDLFVTISQEMKEAYKQLFGVDSIVAMNMTESMRSGPNASSSEGTITLIYAGGLHFNRYKTLSLLANSIARYNLEDENRKAFLKIFSGSEVNRNIKRRLNVPGASQFCGFLDAQELKNELNRCDIPVHVESFDSKSIESTRLSISTKIPEYLSLGKPVLAIGPSEVASIRYIKDSAYCILSPDTIYEELQILLNDENLKNDLSRKALAQFEQNHTPSVVSKRLIESMISTIA